MTPTTTPAHTIVCATDFSEPSRQGLAMAATLGRCFGLPIHVIHVVEPMPLLPMATVSTGFDVTIFREHHLREAVEALARVVEGSFPDDLGVVSKVLKGKPASTIVAYAEAHGAAVVVMASHGAQGWRRHLLGSVTDRVIALSTVPVLVVPEGGGSLDDLADQRTGSRPGQSR